MILLRKSFDAFYDLVKQPIFEKTTSDPKKAHEKFVRLCRAIHSIPFLEEIALDNSSNYQNPGFELSNAAGFNKDGQIPPTILKYLGFDRGNVEL